MINNRQSFRLRKQFDVAWSVPTQKTEGEGIISNISLTGMLFVTDRLFEARQGLDMCFRVAQAPSFPSTGSLVWSRKVGGGSRHQCGVQFLNKDARDPSWIKWMEDNISKLADVGDNKILGRLLSEEQE